MRTAWLAVGDALHSTRLQPSEDTRTSAAGHDAAVPTCLDVLLHADAASVCLFWLPHSPSLCHGGFGLRNAEHHAVVAYRASWTSWADALPVSRVETVPPLKPSHVFRMAPGLCLTLWLPTSCRLPRPHVGCCAAPLCHETTTPPTVYVGGSAPLHALLTSSGTVRAIRRELGAPRLAPLDSQSGLHAAICRDRLHHQTGSPELSLSSPLFCVLLPAPPVPALDFCPLPLPATARPRRGHSGTTWTTSQQGLRARGGPLKRVAARVCRQAGATAAFKVRLRGLNVDVARQDERSIEVIANDLAFWAGTQPAGDTTLVSPRASSAVC